MSCCSSSCAYTKELLQDPDNAMSQDFRPMLAVGRTTNALFADLVTKGTLFEAIHGISRYSLLEEEKSVADLRPHWSFKHVLFVCLYAGGCC